MAAYSSGASTFARLFSRVPFLVTRYLGFFVLARFEKLGAARLTVFQRQILAKETAQFLGEK
jgi:hypothetical protein